LLRKHGNKKVVTADGRYKKWLLLPDGRYNKEKSVEFILRVSLEICIFIGAKFIKN